MPKEPESNPVYEAANEVMAYRTFATILILLQGKLFCSITFVFGQTGADCNGLTPTSLIPAITNNKLPQENLLLDSLKRRECYCHDESDFMIKTQELWRQCFIVCSRHSLPYSNSSYTDTDAQRPTTSRGRYDLRIVCKKVADESSTYVIRSCPDDYGDITNRRLCEEELYIDNITMATVQLVTDDSDGRTYYNKYCAECNQAFQTHKWNTIINCMTSLHLIGALTGDEMARLSLDSRSTCRIDQFIGNSKSPTYFCLNKLHVEEHLVISSCNTTGKETFDTGMSEKCNDGPISQSQRVTNGHHTFKNIFCLYCNSRIVESDQERFGDCQIGESHRNPPFSFLFGKNEEDTGKYDEESNYNKSRCQENEWMDPQGNCKETKCTEGKLLTINECKSPMPLAGLPYRMSVLLVPEAHVPESQSSMRDTSVDDVASSVIHTLKNACSRLCSSIQIHVGVLLDRQVVNTSSNVSGSDNERNASTTQKSFMLPRFVWLKVFIIANTFMIRDNVEPSLIDIFNKSSIVIPIDGYYSTSYKIQFVDESSYDFMSSCTDTPRSMLCGTSVQTYSVAGMSSYFKHVFNRNFGVQNANKSDYLEMRPHLVCPYIEVSHRSVQEIVHFSPVPHVTKIVIPFEDFFFEFTNPIELYQITRGTKSTFYICRALLNSKVPRQIQHLEVSTVFTTIQYYLTIVCVSASLVCLLATVTTYCLCPDLRSVAGCNTLGLCSSLMIAQVCLFVASSTQGPSPLCTAIGIITHYSWLVMFTWMFLCCLHVLRVFAGLRGNSRQSRRQENIEKIANVVLSLMVPALVVVVIVVTYMLMYNGTRIGYGHTRCAMDSAYAINGPLIFVIACNTVFFTIVVINIWKIRRLQASTDIRNDDRKDFVVYIKLSTLTGMFWLMVILGEVFNNDVIRCFAIVANGGQGTFIFFSFVANHRVLGYYKKIFNVKSSNSVTTVGTASHARSTTSMGPAT